MDKFFDKNHSVLDRLERLFALIYLIIYMSAIIPLLIIKGASEGDGTSISSFNFTPLNLLFIINYLITFTLLLLRWEKFVYFLTRNILFLLLILIIPLSFLWSAIPEETLTGSVGMIGSILFGIYIASRFSLREQLNLIGYALFITVILSFVFIILLPKYGVMGGVHAGAARGVFTHKNGLGKHMVLSSLVFLLLLKERSFYKIFAWAGLFGSIGLIIVSSSSAAVINVVVLTLLLFSLMYVFRLNGKSLIAASVFFILLGWATSVLATDITTYVLRGFGKDLTLTGRTDIWLMVIDKIQERPWLGYGFSAFWNGIDGPSAYIINALRWSVPDAHNGFLDFILQLGLLGFLLFILIAWITMFQSLCLAKAHTQPYYLWPLIFLSYTMIVNFSESTLMSQNNFFWILFTMITVSISADFHYVTSQAKIPEEL